MQPDKKTHTNQSVASQKRGNPSSSSAAPLSAAQLKFRSNLAAIEITLWAANFSLFGAYHNSWRREANFSPIHWPYQNKPRPQTNFSHMTTSFLCCHLACVPVSVPPPTFQHFLRLLNCSEERVRNARKARKKPGKWHIGDTSGCGKTRIKMLQLQLAKGKFLMKFATRMRSGTQK